MNKQLTKEECKKACEDLLYIGCDPYYRELRNEIVEKFEQLINEHFDNPPLKFEELEENNWYWDNKDKEWCKYISYSTFEYLDGYGSEFEENRFYRYEVKE